MTQPIDRRDTLSEAAPSLTWLRGVLWDQAGGRVALNPARTSSRPRREWLVLPSAASPTLLAPTRGRAGARALLQFNDSMTQRARLKKAAVGVAIRGRAARLFARDRLAVFLDEPACATDLIESELPRLLGVPRVEVAISVGRSLRPNLKPVIKVMDASGRVLAYAKVAWNPLTAELVENEAATLIGLEKREIKTFRVPRVLHQGYWNGRPLLLLSPVSHGLLRRWPVDALPPLEVLIEMARIGPISRGPLVQSLHWQEVERRGAQAAEGSAGHDLIQRTVAGMRERLKHMDVEHGMSHGDLAPWNMVRAGRTLNVWDWERSSGHRPVGFDVIHFAFEVALYRDGLDPEVAAAAALERTRSVLEQMGVPRSAAPAIRDVYLLELLVRVLEGRRAGVSVPDRLATALVAYLTKHRD